MQDDCGESQLLNESGNRFLDGVVVTVDDENSFVW